MIPETSPTVSVVIPCYNHAHYLPCAVKSVLAQTFTDWEVIIVNDGSTDNTHEVAISFGDPRVHYIHQENRGLSAARNAGIRVARGKYLAFLDADDEWEIDFLTECVTRLETLDIEIAGVYTRNSHIDTDGKRLPQSGGKLVSPRDFRRQLLEGGFFVVHAVLVRTNVISEIGPFDENLAGGGAEDWEFWLRVSERYSMVGIENILARYRVYPGSMATNIQKMHANRMAILTKHLGPPGGDPSQWPNEKRRGYAFAYRATAFGYIARKESDQAWHYLAQAGDIDPTLLSHLDTFYELALGDQPRGYRGEANLVNISANGADLIRRLDAIFASTKPATRKMKPLAYGNAYLALAMLSDQAGEWREARRYLWLGIWYYPTLLSCFDTWKRLFKLVLGQEIVNHLRYLSPGTSKLGAKR